MIICRQRNIERTILNLSVSWNPKFKNRVKIKNSGTPWICIGWNNLLFCIHIPSIFSKTPNVAYIFKKEYVDWNILFYHSEKVQEISFLPKSSEKFFHLIIFKGKIGLYPPSKAKLDRTIWVTFTLNRNNTPFDFDGVLK